jgi:hypothetical protein
MRTWKGFFQQRRRWSSKATYYKDWRITLVLSFVYLFNLYFLLLLAFGIYDSQYFLAVVLYLSGKTIIEIPLIYSVAKFYSQQKLIIYFPFLQPLHITYTILIGIISQFGTYQWKGRKTN